MILLLCASCDRPEDPKSADREGTLRSHRNADGSPEAPTKQRVDSPPPQGTPRLRKELMKLETLEDDQEFGNALKALAEGSTPEDRKALEAYLSRVENSSRYNEGYTKVAEWYLEDNDLVTASLWGKRITGVKGPQIVLRLWSLYEQADAATRAKIDALPDPSRNQWLGKSGLRSNKGQPMEYEPPELPSSVGAPSDGRASLFPTAPRTIKRQ
ncbi:MAG: hypothetical protein QM755_10700 [Luteolibacter sp.]